mgnify:CR=1 FL=1
MADSDGYVKTAFLSQYNLIALGGAVLFSAVSMDPLALLVAAGAELGYLGVVPSLPGFKRMVRRRRALERRASEQQTVDRMLEELSPNQRDYYHALRDLRDKTLENYRRLPGGALLAESSTERIDALLVSFVRLLSTLNNYRHYLNNMDRKPLEKELAELRVEMSGGEGGSAELQGIKKRRIEILEKRLEKFDRAAESREIISHQLASIEDFMRLLHEQSITQRDPETVEAQLEHLSMEIQATDETVREMEKLITFTDELGSVAPPMERQRVR